MKTVIKSIIAIIVIAISMPSCAPTQKGTCYGGYKPRAKMQTTFWSDPTSPKFLVKKQKKGLSYSSLFCR